MNNLQIVFNIITILTSISCFYAAYLDFTGSENVKEIADRLGISHRLMLPFGILLMLGGIGLLVGFLFPIIGKAAALGLIVYFICAIGAHLKVGDFKIGGAIFFLAMSILSFWR